MPKNLAIIRKQLDARFEKTNDVSPFPRPHTGWIRAIRSSLGMTAAQLAKRLGVSQPRVTVLEKDEVKRKLTLQTLEKTAVALNCTLVYALVPNSSLEKMVQERAEKIAESRLKTVGHSMNLEGQSVSADDENVHRRELIEKIILRESRHLWEQL